MVRPKQGDLSVFPESSTNSTEADLDGSLSPEFTLEPSAALYVLPTYSVFTFEGKMADGRCL